MAVAWGVDDRETIGRRIRRIRLGQGMSQDRLARAADIGRATVIAIENGATRTPTGETLALIAGALGVSEVFLLTGSEPAPEGTRLPELPVYMRLNTDLDERDIDAVVRIIRSLEAARGTERTDEG